MSEQSTADPAYQDRHISIDSEQLVVGARTFSISNIQCYTVKPDLALTGCSGIFLIPLSVPFFSAGIISKVVGGVIVAISAILLLGSRRNVLSLTVGQPEADPIEEDILVGQFDYLEPITDILDQLGVPEHRFSGETKQAVKLPVR